MENIRENNPFLNMLAALEEQQPGSSNENGQQQWQQQNRSGNVKLPDFWPSAPGIWFARVELRFEVCGIVSEREKFAHTVNALTQEASRLVTDLIIAPLAERPLTVLKERLLLAHQLTAVQKAMKVMAMAALGDRRPSQLLADMLEHCPAGEEASAFFRGSFIQRLPAELQVLLDGAEDGDMKDLAAKADKLWAIRRPSSLHVAAIEELNVEGDLDQTTVAAVRPGNTNNNKAYKGKSAANSGGRDADKKRKPKTYAVCYRHMRYGADAFRCDDPTVCKWSGN